MAGPRERTEPAADSTRRTRRALIRGPALPGERTRRAAHRWERTTRVAAMRQTTRTRARGAHRAEDPARRTVVGAAGGDAALTGSERPRGTENGGTRAVHVA